MSNQQLLNEEINIGTEEKYEKAIYMYQKQYGIYQYDELIDLFDSVKEQYPQAYFYMYKVAYANNHISEAMKYLAKAAELQIAEAEYVYAVHLLYGDDISRDLGLSLKYLERSAVKDNYDALSKLLFLYKTGTFVDKDPEKAFICELKIRNGYHSVEDKKLKEPVNVTTKTVEIPKDELPALDFPEVIIRPTKINFDLFKVLLLTFDSNSKEIHEMSVIEDFYKKYRDVILENPVESILTEDIKNEIDNGNLPRLKDSEKVVKADEDLFFINHVRAFQLKGKDKYDEIAGTLYITNERIVITNELLSFEIESVNRVIQYDSLPEVLEIQADGGNYYLVMSDAIYAYKVLCDLVAARYKTKQVVDVDKNYTDLIKNGDLASAIFAFNTISNKKVDKELKEATQEVIVQLKKMEELIEELPEKKEEITNFISQYMPSTVNIIMKYLQCVNTSMQKDVLETLYVKVYESIVAFAAAIKGRINNINNEQAMILLEQASMVTLSLESDRLIDDKLPYSFAELKEKADIDACIITFEHVSSYDLPSEMSAKIKGTISKLRGLKKVLDTYPDRREELYRFLRYYIPQVISLIVQFKDYYGTSMEDTKIDNIYNKIIASIDQVYSAIEDKTNEIYKFESMRTVSEADALSQILSQDGYSLSNSILKH